MPRLYLKKWLPTGQTFGLREGPKQSVRHVARLYPDRGTEVNEPDATKLREKYPDHIGDFDNDKDRVITRARRKEQQRRDEERRMSGASGVPQSGPAEQPIFGRKARIKRREEAVSVPDTDIVEEEIVEEDLNAEIDDGNDKAKKPARPPRTSPMDAMVNGSNGKDDDGPPPPDTEDEDGSEFDDTGPFPE